MSTISKSNLQQYILRKLGYPVQNIEISEDQLDDCINDALELFNDHHDDATEYGFIELDITDNSVTEYTLDDSIVMVTEILKDGGDNRIFPVDVEPIAFIENQYYPYVVNYDIVSVEVYRQRIGMVNIMNDNRVNYDFNEQLNKLIIFAPEIGKYALKVMKSYNNDTNVLNDKWFRNYCVALAKKQWGTNLMKYEGANLPGGATFNYNTILSEAKEEIDKLELDLEEKYSSPLTPYIA